MLGLLVLLPMLGCDGIDRTPVVMVPPDRAPVGPPTEPAPTFRPSTGLPHGILVDDGTGRKLRLHIATLVSDGWFSSGFGTRQRPMGGGHAHHDGIDIAAHKGTAIRAAADGEVAAIGWYGDYGRFILLRHGDRVETAYAHMTRFAKGLRIGSVVKQDETIGFVGSTGRSTSPHLHFELRLNGEPVNPFRLPKVPRAL